eukprot:g19004.t1
MGIFPRPVKFDGWAEFDSLDTEFYVEHYRYKRVDGPRATVPLPIGVGDGGPYLLHVVAYIFASIKQKRYFEHDLELLRIAVKIAGRNLRHASEHLRNTDAELNKAAVLNDACALEFAGKRFQEDPQFIVQLLNDTKMCSLAFLIRRDLLNDHVMDYFFAPRRQDVDDQWLRAALTCPLEIVIRLGTKLLNRKLWFVKSLVEKDGRVLPFLPKKFRDRKDLLFLALKTDPYAPWRRLPYRAECFDGEYMAGEFGPLNARSARGGTGRIDARRERAQDGGRRPALELGIVSNASFETAGAGRDCSDETQSVSWAAELSSNASFETASSGGGSSDETQSVSWAAELCGTHFTYSELREMAILAIADDYEHAVLRHRFPVKYELPCLGEDLDAPGQYEEESVGPLRLFNVLPEKLRTDASVLQAVHNAYPRPMRYYATQYYHNAGEANVPPERRTRRWCIRNTYCPGMMRAKG